MAPRTKMLLVASLAAVVANANAQPVVDTAANNPFQAVQQAVQGILGGSAAGGMDVNLSVCVRVCACVSYI